ncbi:MAG: hypothetical protein MZV70_70140 [Desulfobacterales bacterium]|nr:hypothetical protein [Desulfobacterales bacterium]
MACLKEEWEFLPEVPDISANITSSVKKVSNVPVWVKLSPNVSDIAYLAQVCLESGADGIVAINTVKGFSGIDIETMLPKLNVNGASAYGGFSGKIIKPIALKKLLAKLLLQINAIYQLQEA